DTVVIKISNYDDDYDYVWDSETAEILYQNGDSVVVVWNEIGGQTLVVTPSKNGISGDEIVYNFDIKEEVIIPVDEKPIDGNKEDEDSEENNDPVAVETEAVSVLAYPNPTVDIVNVKVSGAVDVVAIELYDLLGRKLMSVDGSTTEISLQGMAKGVYKLMVRTQTKTMVTSVILK
ncbi:MAG: T9SS type A sorting domain-containing protein, partial [Paludibacteraceae bacterium]|nr:T9SS type A sorting domain-containing protein [Paludibacteraceae bacterium]